MIGARLPGDDGRNVDPEIGTLGGEGAEQRLRDLDAGAPLGTRRVDPEVPSDAMEEGTYYGLPLLAEPVWRWYIPAYFFVGGVAGAAAALGAATQLSLGGAASRRTVRGIGPWRLVRRCRMIATAGAVGSAALLILDLGRPARFLNMLRVFRPSSPMNMGTWILSAFGGCAGAATAAHVLPLPRGLRRAGDAVALGTGLMGLPLCSYTGVLVANTAVPIWQGTRRSLPILFAASGGAGAASLLELWPPGGVADDAVHVLSVAGKALEAIAMEVFHREAAMVPRVARPLRRGASGALWRGAQLLSLAGLAATVGSRRGSARRRAAGLLGLLGSLTLRFAVMQAGRQSVRDPRAVTEQQRAARASPSRVAHEPSRPVAETESLLAPAGAPTH
jgi:formate-dependent nitrite reductase membrane component NrfD